MLALSSITLAKVTFYIMSKCPSMRPIPPTETTIVPTLYFMHSSCEGISHYIYQFRVWNYYLGIKYEKKLTSIAMKIIIPIKIKILTAIIYRAHIIYQLLFYAPRFNVSYLSVRVPNTLIYATRIYKLLEQHKFISFYQDLLDLFVTATMAKKCHPNWPIFS